MLTKIQNAIRYIVFKEDEVWYAVALEFSVVVDAETPEEALLCLFEAITLVLEEKEEAEREGKKLFIPAPNPEYENLWIQFTDQSGPSQSPYKIYTAGLRRFA